MDRCYATICALSQVSAQPEKGLSYILGSWRIPMR